MNFEEFARDSGKALTDATAPLRPPKIGEISSRHRRATLAAGAVGIAALLVGAVAVAGAINRDGPAVPPATSFSTATTMRAEPAPDPVVVDLLDGSRLEAISGIDLELSGYFFFLDRPELGGVTNVYVTPVEDPAEAAAAERAELEADLGSGVQIWRGSGEGDPLFMSVDLDGWVVFLHVGWDTPPDSADLLALAGELRGEVTDHGVILPNRDIETFTTYLESQDTQNQIHLGIGECLKELVPGSEVVEHPERGEVIRGSNYASWCDTANDLEVRVHGDSGFVFHRLSSLTLSRSYPDSKPTTTSMPPPSTTPTTAPAPTEPDTTQGDRTTAFHPDVRVSDGIATVRVTFTDGTSADISWPEDFHFASDGLLPEAVAFVPTAGGPDARNLVIHHGPFERIVETYGDGSLLDEYPGAGGSTVQFWRFPSWEWDYLVYEFGSWVVMVYDYRVLADARMTEEERSMWARNLRGIETESGFLTLDANAPLDVGGPEFHWPPEIVLSSPDGDIRLEATPCEESDSSDVHWCDETGQIRISTPGEPSAFETRVRQNLTVSGVDLSS